MVGQKEQKEVVLTLAYIHYFVLFYSPNNKSNFCDIKINNSCAITTCNNKTETVLCCTACYKIEVINT